VKPEHLTVAALLLATGQSCRFDYIQRVPALVEAVTRRVAEKFGLDESAVDRIESDFRNDSNESCAPTDSVIRVERHAHGRGRHDRGLGVAEARERSQ
jgi:hypothetical protein